MTMKFLANSENTKILTDEQEQFALLEFTEEKTKAYLTMFPPVDGKTIDADEIISSLKNEGILDIDIDIVQRTIKNNQFNSKILIASGISPIKGKSAYLLYQFGVADEGPVIEIIPGQILSVTVPPEDGISGITVTGETIIPQKGEALEIILGENTALSSDGLKSYATDFGYVTWTGNKVEIEKIEERSSTGQVYSDEIYLSVLVNANSLSEAKEIGADLLNLSPNELDCQTGIIEDDINEASLSLIRIFRLGVKGPWEEEWKKKIESEISRLKIDNKDGIFEFFNTDKGLYLSIFPPQGTGKIVTLENVQNYIKKKGFLDVNQELLKKVVEHPSPKGIPLLIGLRQRVLELDGQVEIEVAPDHSKAVMFVIPPKHGGLPASFEDAMEALQEKEVVAGIDERVVAKAIFEQTTKPVLVAEAILPTPGEAAKLEYKFRVDRSRVELVEDEYGRVDFKRLNLIENVRAGQVLVVKRPPGKGIPGKLVNGLEIPALSGPDVRMPAGRNTEISIGGTELMATVNGQVLLAADKVNVEDTLEIKGDVSLQTGNIYFLGTILIQGNVEDDFEVEATGDIQIKNAVGKCFLSAGGSIAIGEGVKGKGKARLFAGQHIFAKYIENAKIEAKGTIQVTQEIMHSLADAGKSILLEGKQRGSIIGGHIRVGDEIRAREIGAPAGTYTRIEVGGTPKVREQLANLNRVYQKDINRLETIKKDISILKDKKNQEKEKFPIEKEAKLQKLIREHNKLTVKLHRYTDQKEFLEVRIQEALGGSIHVSHTLFQGVSIGIRNANLEIKDNYNSVSLGPKGDEVGIFPYGMVKG
ncbi:MAG: FapA family protein [bacterium]|nr:FapA family protein [bacterium]